MKTNSKFIFPKIKKSKSNPIWNHDHFIVDDKKKRILVYNSTNEGWSEDLTTLHEENVGSEHPIDITSRKMTLNCIKKFFKETNNNILEIGSSSGFMIEDLNKNLPKNFYVGSDIIPINLEKVASNNKNIPFICFDILKCPLPRNSFDIVIILNVLEHIKDDELALIKINKLLKKNGKVFIEVPANQELYDNYDSQLMHFRRYSSKELIMKLNNSGFKIKYKTAVGFFAYPAFYIIKKINRFRNNVNTVEQQTRKTKSSFILKIIFCIERFLSKIISYPFGIRLYIVAEKK